MHTNIHQTCLSKYICKYMYIHTCLPSNNKLPTCIQHMHTSIHTYIHVD